MFVQCAVVIVAFVEMFAINVPLMLVTMLSLPLTFVFGLTMRKRIFPVSWVIQARLAQVATIVEENVSGVRIVKHSLPSRTRSRTWPARPTGCGGRISRTPRSGARGRRWWKTCPGPGWR